MPTFSLDTSCLIAAVCGWHERHDAAAAEVDGRLDRGERMTVPAHALVEAYAVLTRLPAPHRLSTADAWTLLRTNFVEAGAVTEISGRQQINLLKQLAAAGIGGGRSYDAVIAAAAHHGGADALLTFNPRDFEKLPQTPRIVEPPDPPPSSNRRR
jgi:predicted nucleic acid-binding protein